MVSSCKSDRDVSMVIDSSEQAGIIPSPPSRLDFDARRGSDLLKPPTTLSQTMDMGGLVAMNDSIVRITSARQSSAPTSERPQMHTERGTAPFLPRGQSAGDVAHPSNTARSPSAPRTKAPSVSRLSFPFVTTSPRRKKAPAIVPPTRHKYSCFPTKLSPFPSERPAPVHQRHNYRHHGHSRLALDYVKWFWSVRAEEWHGPKGANAGSKTCDVDSPPSITTIHPTRIAALCEPHSCQEISVPISINPRRGDIFALRDPYWVELDRSFMTLPSWTIAKVLWMYELHLALANRRRHRLQITWDEDISDVESDFELDISRSTSCSSISDDSEGTLVDADIESDYFSSSHLRCSSGGKKFSIQSDYSSASTTPAISPLPSPSSSQQSFDQILHSLYVDSSHKLHHTFAQSAWAMKSYNGWEILKSLLDGRPTGQLKLSMQFRS